MTTNNHPAHGPVSLERLHQIREILSKASAQSDGGNLGYAMADAVKVIDGAIAAFGAEPVSVNDDMAYAFHHALSDSSLGADEVDEIKTGLRAAFASVTAQPETEVPDTLPCPVHLEPGLKFGKGVRTQCMLDALRRRADYYAELEAMTPEQRAEHDAVIAEFKAMLGMPAPVVPDEMPDDCGFKDSYIDGWNACRAAMLQAGNSPVTPDGWIPVSERMPDKYDFDIWVFSPSKGIHDGIQWDGCEFADDEYQFKINDVSHWMKKIYPAAPQQEVKP
ncbi:DUF551 domain-containing protein [Citrobacter freundii]